MPEPQAVFSKTNSHASIDLNDIDPSWINTLPNGKLINKLRGSSRISPSLIESVYSNLDLKDINPDESKGFIKEIHFYSPKQLQGLVLKAGVIPFGEKLKSIIIGNEVRQIRQQLGRGLFDFSLHNNLPTINTPQYSKELLLLDQNINTKVIAIGYHSLETAMQNIHNNCKYKLPVLWKKTHESFFRVHQLSAKEKLFHINLIKSLVDNSPPAQS